MEIVDLVYFQKIMGLLIPIYLIFEVFVASAEHLPEVILLPAKKSVTIGKQIQYLKDPGGRLTPTDFTEEPRPNQWEISHRNSLYLGGEKDFVWVRFQVKNPTIKEGTWILNIDWPFFDVTKLYIHDPEKKRWSVIDYLGGKSLNTNTMKNGQLPYAFRFSCPGNGVRVFFLKLHSKSKFLLPMQIWEEKSYHLMALHRNILLGVFFGILIAMFCYNTSLFFFTRDDSYAYYVIYVFSLIFYCLGMTGVGKAYVWTNQDWINAHAFGLFSSISFLLAALFIRRFLSLKTIGGWLLRLSDIMVIFWILIVFLYAALNQRWLLIFEDIGAVVSCAVGLGITLIVWARGNTSAKYLAIAWTFPILFTFILMLGLMGFIKYNSLIQNSQNLAFVLEVILLSLALADRINRECIEKEAAQKLSLKLLEETSELKAKEMDAQKKIIAVEQAAKEDLEQKVKLRTQELQKALGKLETANQSLSLLSRTDGLTKIYNRRYFDEIYAIEFKRAKRLALPLSVIIGDIDYFKKINDTYGHQVGDECLRMVAETWRNQMSRAGDIVARYGGEEFIAVLPATDVISVKSVAEKIRAAIETSRYQHNGKHIPLTISLGISSLIGENDTAAALLKRADEAMYRAKMQGRNRVAGYDGK
jgi:diguanylate cyclase (GGDEF)-like protein